MREAQRSIDVNDMLYQLSHATKYAVFTVRNFEPVSPRCFIHRMREAQRSIDVNDMLCQLSHATDSFQPYYYTPILIVLQVLF
jgi:hypothetical protein